MTYPLTRWAARTARMLAIGLALMLGALPPSPASAQVELQMRDADLRSFAEIVAEATGRNFVIDPAVRGTVTVLAPGDLSPAELYEVFDGWFADFRASERAA